jgi:hypothetical protein
MVLGTNVGSNDGNIIGFSVELKDVSPDGLIEDTILGDADGSGVIDGINKG